MPKEQPEVLRTAGATPPPVGEPVVPPPAAPPEPPPAPTSATDKKYLRTATISFRCTEAEKQEIDAIIKRRREHGYDTDYRTLFFDLLKKMKKNSFLISYPGL